MKSSVFIICFVFLSLLLSSPILVVSTSSFLRHRNKVNQKITGNCDCETPLVRVDSMPNMGLLQPLNFLEMSCDERCQLEKKEAEKNGEKILAAENPATDDKNAEKNTAEAATGTKEDTSEETNSSTPPPQQQQEVGKNLVVKSGVVSDQMFRFGTMSSLAYANENVEEKEHAWYKFWRTPKVTEQDKVIHGINYIEEHIKTDGKFSETQELDRELSSREATIFVDKAIKEVVVSFKGTNFLSGEDLAADYALFDNDAIKAFGVVGVGAAGGPAAAAVAASASLHVQKHGMKEINEAISLIRNVHAKYSDFTIATTGHSLGGAKALFVAQMFPTIVSESIAFNPGPLGKKGMTCNNCKIVRTENDIISIQSRGVADVVLTQKDGNFVSKAWDAHTQYTGQTAVPDIEIDKHGNADYGNGGFRRANSTTTNTNLLLLQRDSKQITKKKEIMKMVGKDIVFTIVFKNYV